VREETGSSVETGVDTADAEGRDKSVTSVLSETVPVTIVETCGPIGLDRVTVAV
jgi:hypothetical protein